jgi:hypothetical protein
LPGLLPTPPVLASLLKTVITPPGPLPSPPAPLPGSLPLPPPPRAP